MPSLPPRDGVVASPRAGIRAGASTVLADATFKSDVGTSLPAPPTGEHDAFGGGSGGKFLSPLCALREHGGGTSPRAAIRSLEWVDGTLARYHRGGNAIAEICGPSGTFLSPPRAICEHGGGMSPSAAARPLGWVDGTLARFLWGVNHLVPLATSRPLRTWGGNVRERDQTIARMGQWHPRPLPQGQQSHCRARTALFCQLGHLPLHPPQREGGIT